MTSHRSSRIIAASVGLAAASSLFACKNSHSQSGTGAGTASATAVSSGAPGRVYKVGETATAPAYRLTVSAVKTCHSKYAFSKPENGTIWVGVEVTLQSTLKKPLFASPGSGKLIDGSGVTRNATFQVTKDCNPGFASRQLAQGERAHGWIVFDVPKEAENLRLRYAPSVFGKPQTTEFELGR